jgi:hypothetical protein
MAHRPRDLTPGAFGGLITARVAVSAAMVGGFTAAVAKCIVVPILGCFVGLPIVVFAGLMVAMCWATALGAELCAWALVARLIAGRR